MIKTVENNHEQKIVDMLRIKLFKKEYFSITENKRGKMLRMEESSGAC